MPRTIQFYSHLTVMDDDGRSVPELVRDVEGLINGEFIAKDEWTRFEVIVAQIVYGEDSYVRD